MVPAPSEFRAFVRVEERGGIIPEAQEIRSHFEYFGTIVDVYNPASAKDTSYVSFSTQEELEACLIESQQAVCSLACSVQRAQARGGGSAAGRSAPSAGRSPDRIYVTGLAETVTEESLRSYFSNFGMVNDVYMPMDRHTGVKKPFAFVTMSSQGEVSAVLDMATHSTLDGPISCSAAEARDKGGGKGFEKGFGGKSGYAPVQSYGHALSQPRHSPISYAKGQAKGKGAGYYAAAGGGRPIVPNAGPAQGIPGEARLFVFGMPDGLNADMLRGHFARHGEINDIYIPTGKTDIAYITFSAEAELQDALLNSGMGIAGYWVQGVKRAEARGAKGKGKGDRSMPY